MAFNFSNIPDLLQKYQQFQTFLNQCGKDPSQLLQDELKRRNINGDQFKELLRSADALKILFSKRN